MMANFHGGFSEQPWYSGHQDMSNPDMSNFYGSPPGSFGRGLGMGEKRRWSFGFEQHLGGWGNNRMTNSDWVPFGHQESWPVHPRYPHAGPPGGWQGGPGRMGGFLHRQDEYLGFQSGSSGQRGTGGWRGSPQAGEWNHNQHQPGQNLDGQQHNRIDVGAGSEKGHSSSRCVDGREVARWEEESKNSDFMPDGEKISNSEEVYAQDENRLSDEQFAKVTLNWLHFDH